MDEIYFVRTRHLYESYRDFWRLVELSDFPTIYVDEVDISEPGVYIVCPMNGEWRDHINNQHKERRPVQAHLILWNLERPSGSAGSVGEYGQQGRYLMYGLWPNGKQVREDGERSYGRFIDEVWVSDRRLGEETQLRFVTLGSHYGLGEPSTIKEYDFVHMSYETGRRTGIYSHFDRDKIGPNCWPPERHEVLKSSRFALNVHQDHHPFQEPLRFALFAAYGLPIISESIYDAYPWSEEYMIFNSYDGMVGKMRQVIEDPDYEKFEAMGMRARDRMCNEFNFRRMVEQAVEQSVYSWR